MGGEARCTKYKAGRTKGQSCGFVYGLGMLAIASQVWSANVVVNVQVLHKILNSALKSQDLKSSLNAILNGRMKMAIVVKYTRLMVTVPPVEITVITGISSLSLLTKARLLLLVLNVDASLIATKIGKIFMVLVANRIKNFPSVLAKGVMGQVGLMLHLTILLTTGEEQLLCVLNVAVKVLTELILLLSSIFQGVGQIMVGRLLLINV